MITLKKSLLPNCYVKYFIIICTHKEMDNILKNKKPKKVLWTNLNTNYWESFYKIRMLKSVFYEKYQK